MIAYIDNKGLLHLSPEADAEEFIMQKWTENIHIVNKTYRSDACGYIGGESRLSDITLDFEVKSA